LWKGEARVWWQAEAGLNCMQLAVAAQLCAACGVVGGAGEPIGQYCGLGGWCVLPSVGRQHPVMH